MTSDRERWNGRYAAGAYQSITHPSDYLAQHIETLSRGRALDIACGAGRNSLFLASRGYDVDAVDVSDVALARAAASAEIEGLAVHWIQMDLTGEIELSPPYDLIINIRYVDLDLARRAADWLSPGGTILLEQHLAFETDIDLAGPSSHRFRVAPGALREAMAGLSILDASEGLVEDPDGKPAALARIIAQRDD